MGLFDWAERLPQQVRKNIAVGFVVIWELFFEPIRPTRYRFTGKDKWIARWARSFHLATQIAEREGMTNSIRPDRRQFGLSGRFGVLYLGIVGGLMALLMMAAVGCDDKSQPATTAEPADTLASTGTPPPPVDSVEVHESDTSSLESEPPFPDIDKLGMSSGIPITGRFEVVSELQTVSRRDRPADRVTYYEASVGVDRMLFGQRPNRVNIQVPVRTVTNDDRHTPVEAPSQEVGETALLFLNQDDSSFDLKGNDFMIAGGGEAWGKIFVGDGRETTLDPAVESEPLDEVTEWINAARFSLAKPGLLAEGTAGRVRHGTVHLRILGVRFRIAVSTPLVASGQSPQPSGPASDRQDP